jgi:hypothetical protein
MCVLVCACSCACCGSLCCVVVLCVLLLFFVYCCCCCCWCSVGVFRRCSLSLSLFSRIHPSQQRLSLPDLMELEHEQVHILSLIRRAQESVLEREPHSPHSSSSGTLRTNTFSSSDHPAQVPSASLRRRRLTSQMLSRSKPSSEGSLAQPPIASRRETFSSSPLSGSRKHTEAMTREQMLEFAVRFFHYFLMQGSNIFQLEHVGVLRE